MNAWNAQVAAEVSASLQQANGDSEVRAIVITGAGRAFSAGRDLKGVLEGREKPGAWRYKALEDLSKPVIAVPNFGSLAAMIKGTDRITTQIGVMKLGLLKELESAPLPFKTDPLDLFLIWHRREHEDPAHRWFREKIVEATKSIPET